MKKILFLLIMFSTLFLVSCKIVEDSKPSTDLSVEKEIGLLDIKLDSTFSDEDLLNFQKELDDLEKKENLGIDDILRKATLYDYLGNPGKGIITYSNYLVENEATFVIHNNIGNLYDEICKIEDKINIEYCNKAIENYQEIIDKYDKNIYYTYITMVYIKIDNIEKAKEVYEDYLNKGGKTDSIIEKKLKTSN